MNTPQVQTSSSVVPYWRLSGFYFFYFASLGALLPYWNPYLKTLGYSSFEIGFLMAIVMGTKIVAPNIWGWIADHTGKRMFIVRLASFLSVLCFAGVFIHSGFAWLVIVMITFSFFWNASLPQFEATTMSHLETDTHRYNVIRSWGSIGFIIAAVGLGWLVEWKDLSLVPFFILLLFLTIWLSSLVVPEYDNKPVHVEHESLKKVLMRKEVIALLLSCLLIQASHGAYYTFYSIYLEGYGYSNILIGQLWALGVIAEIILFVMMFHLMPRYGARRLFLLALLLTSVRWVLVSQWPDSLMWLVVAQLLHAASFGVVHAVAIHLIHLFFTGKHQGRGQALYSSMSFGVGGALGSFLSGVMWQSAGGEKVFLVSAVFAALSFLVAFWGVRESRIN